MYLTNKNFFRTKSNNNIRNHYHKRIPTYESEYKLQNNDQVKWSSRVEGYPRKNEMIKVILSIGSQ
jgi:hypothetical protein